MLKTLDFKAPIENRLSERIAYIDVARFLYFYRNKPLSFQQAGHFYEVSSMRIAMLVKPIYKFIQRR